MSFSVPGPRPDALWWPAAWPPVGRVAGAYSLFGRVGELVLPPPVVALLDAGVVPQGLDGTDVPVLESRHLLHIYFPDQERIGL